MKTARLFFDGDDQAVELPAEFEFEGTEVYIWWRAQTGEVVLSAEPPKEEPSDPKTHTSPEEEGLPR
jgi:virulence-associated protein VagC